MFDRVLSTPLIIISKVNAFFQIFFFRFLLKETLTILFTLTLRMFTLKNLRKLSQRNWKVGNF